jgi:hypothetical protein
VNLAFRYPVDVAHELGADTTFVHTLSTGIILDGHAAWAMHPLSYFGLYALSYPSGIPFVLAVTSEVTSTPIEGSMLFFGWVVAIAGGLGAYLAARSIRRDDLFALGVALLFSLTPFYIKDTFWVGSSRGFVVGLLPVFVLLLVKSARTMSLRYLLPAVFLMFLLTSIHRMGVLTFFIFVAYLFAMPFHRVTQRLRFALLKYERPARYGFFLSGITGFVSIFYIQFAYPGISGANVVEQYGRGVLNGTSFPVVLANVGFSLAGKVGPLIPFSLVGLVAYTWRRPKEAVDKFVLATVLLFLPLLSLRDYIAEFMFLFFVILLVFGLFSLQRLRPNRRKLLSVLVVGLVASSVATSWLMKDYWRDRYSTDAPIPNGTYSTGTYIRYMTSGTVLANDGLLGGHLAAVSGQAVLPLGGPSLHWTSPQQLLWGFVDPGGVAVRALDVWTISFNTDSIFVPVNVRNAEVDWEAIHFDSPGAAQNVQFYHVRFVVVDKRIPFQFQSYGYDRPSRLLQLLDAANYRVYDSPQQSVWYLT